MHAPGTNQRVLSLIREGLSQRRISVLLNISRGTIGSIVKGKRHETPVEEEPHRPEGEPVRCPDCGSRTQLPCTFCRAIANVEKYGITPYRETADVPEFAIDLEGSERERYLAVREWRENYYKPHCNELPENWPFREAHIAKARRKKKANRKKAVGSEAK